MEKLTNFFKDIPGPHPAADLYVYGEKTKQALILLHGRGGSAEDIATLYEALSIDVFTLIPEAVTHSWYPNRFLVP